MAINGRVARLERTYQRHRLPENEAALTLRFIASGRLDTRPLIEHEFPATRVADAYRLIEDSPQTLGVLLNWQK